MVILIGSISAFVASLVVTGGLINWLHRRGTLDQPNHRSSHTVPTPRGGGLGIVVGVCVGWTILRWSGQDSLPLGLLSGGLLMAGLGWLDDVRGGLNSLLRLSAQIAIAWGVLVMTGPLELAPLPAPLNLPLGGLALPVSLLWFVGVINLYNFMDGIDGIAGCQAVVAGIGWAWIVGADQCVLGWLIAGAALGFLRYNWQPAKIFMGDVGSMFLGYCFAAMPFFSPMEPQLGVMWVAVLLWMFLADGSLTLIRRLINGEKVWRPHRSHLYQRLVLLGWSHASVTGLVTSSSLALAIAGVITYRANGKIWLLLLICACVFAAYALLVTTLERRARQ